jgi:cation:H+ antiporter
MAKRRRGDGNLNFIQLEKHQCVEVIGLIGPLLYIAVITAKSSLSVYDGAVLAVIYVAYLVVLSKLPPEDPDEIHELDTVPRAIVTAPRLRRIFYISTLFVAGGLLIYFSAEPFLSSLLSISAAVGIPTFVFVQWVAPLVSEFPEMASTFYWARTVEKAPMALMNMVSSNINQWTLLPAMLAVVYAISVGQAVPIVFDEHQQLELILTLGQAVIGLLFLINMRLAWWEAALMLVFFLIPFANSAWAKPIAILQYAWVGIQLVLMISRRRTPEAFRHFGEVWRTHIRPRSS